jgi:hypothetical protein
MRRYHAHATRVGEATCHVLDRACRVGKATRQALIDCLSGMGMEATCHGQEIVCRVGEAACQARELACDAVEATCTQGACTRPQACEAACQEHAHGCRAAETDSQELVMLQYVHRFTFTKQGHRFVKGEKSPRLHATLPGHDHDLLLFASRLLHMCHVWWWFKSRGLKTRV